MFKTAELAPHQVQREQVKKIKSNLSGSVSGFTPYAENNLDCRNQKRSDLTLGDL